MHCPPYICSSLFPLPSYLLPAPCSLLPKNQKFLPHKSLNCYKCLLWGYLRRYVSDGGNYIDISKGISKGCPLSPLIGALFLKPLDDRMARLGCFYVRYMDDWVILAPTRWKLRKAIKATNAVMNELKVLKHPEKTFIGRIASGFDFLGYWFSSSGLRIARKTVERMLENLTRLYERGAPIERIEAYFQRWWRWVKGGISAPWLSGFLSRDTLWLSE
ncbi:reverse transcriptase domain-containing protein [Moorena sp. SIO4G3]|uniref:reverse transcriptase domain-containing protein n=1 Tax=Moorena sp. SIO4G3 TaxID=2607821 RepID=UPI00142C7918|nr:reverse transcriptase domain-containing protein [Moorena sp. SIO4G3]NEO82046.1 hypothetical protein [Moorena sp. SIO4G3]